MLQSSSKCYQVHHLASELRLQGVLPDLDKDPNKSLFKRNFLLMNALFQLQAMLLPDQWLQIRTLDIQLITEVPSNVALILEQDEALRGYYLDWTEFETSAEEIDALFSYFWQRFDCNIGQPHESINREQALLTFELEHDATSQMIRHQWRKLALKWHPDRPHGDADKFRDVCEAWKILSGH